MNIEQPRNLVSATDALPAKEAEIYENLREVARLSPSLFFEISDAALFPLKNYNFNPAQQRFLEPFGFLDQDARLRSSIIDVLRCTVHHSFHPNENPWQEGRVSVPTGLTFALLPAEEFKANLIALEVARRAHAAWTAEYKVNAGELEPKWKDIGEHTYSNRFNRLGLILSDLPPDTIIENETGDIRLLSSLQVHVLNDGEWIEVGPDYLLEHPDSTTFGVVETGRGERFRIGPKLLIEIDIAGREFDMLSKLWRRENEASAEAAVNQLKRAWSQDLSTVAMKEALDMAKTLLASGQPLGDAFEDLVPAGKFLLQAGDDIHSLWLSRNRERAMEEQLPPFLELSAEQQLLDLKFLESALEVSLEFESEAFVHDKQE